MVAIWRALLAWWKAEPRWMYLPKTTNQESPPRLGCGRYQLYRAAQEWDLVDPILIKDRQDLSPSTSGATT